MKCLFDLQIYAGGNASLPSLPIPKSLASTIVITFILLLTQGGLRAGKWMSSLCKMSSLRNICTTCACATQHSTKTKERATITTYNRHNITTIISFPPWTVPNHQRKFVHIHVIIYSFSSRENISYKLTLDIGLTYQKLIKYLMQMTSPTIKVLRFPHAIVT